VSFREFELRITTGILIGFAIGALLILATHVHVTGTAVVWYSEPKGPDVMPGTITVFCFAPGWQT
jgi:hypothetical protein